MVPNKDVKTMLLAFDIVKRSVPEARLKIMGNCEEDPVYYQECVDFLAELGTEDVEFLGLVNIKGHLRGMAQAILRLLRNPALMRSMGQAGRKRVEAYYTREGMLAAYRDIYERLKEVSHGRNRV